MLFYSTGNKNIRTDFRSATIEGQAPDKGLYFPEEIPRLSSSFLSALNKISREEIAYEVIRPYVGDAIPTGELQHIVRETVSFDFPLVGVTDTISSLELFHGPTLAFKDVGARFMSRCLGYFMQQELKEITVLVATSGDTGGAVANGFYDVAGIKVIILYPSGKVSNMQEAQLTTLGKNILALEVQGDFDDCQRMVKNAFADRAILEKRKLTSANSINIARWLPQQFYYFFALQQWMEQQPPVISVPSGNFGNICAGLLACQSGLPVAHFIAACNANATIPNYLQEGIYKAEKTIPTISNAMDVSEPSNFVRILEIFHQSVAVIKEKMSAYSITDEETKRIIARLYKENGYLPDPHGAVGFFALEKYMERHPGQKGIFLETAHPVKFHDVIEAIIEQPVPVPSSLQELLRRKTVKQQVRTEQEFRDILLS